MPEQIGGNRNWDYRYSWVRDSSLVLDALVGSGHAEIAAGFRDFLLRSAAGSAADLQIMYGAYGERRLPELELRARRLPRFAPGARRQRGRVRRRSSTSTAICSTPSTHGTTAARRSIRRMRRFLRDAVDIAARRWCEPDQGIWEMRGEPQHFVNSKVMCWVALDRGIGLA